MQSATGLTIDSNIETRTAKPLINKHPLGRFPLLTLTAAASVLLLACAYNASRAGATWADLLYWESLLLLFVPIALRLFSTQPTRSERIALVVLLGAGLYMVKVLHSPIGFTFSDEFSHWRTVFDIEQSHHLFTNNPLLPVSPYYPGLEIATSAITSLTGLSVYDAGVLLLGVVRIMFSLGLFLLLEQVSKSSRIAGVATLLYMTNNNFTYFSAQFAYESLALPLAVAGLYLIVRRVYAPIAERFALTLAALLCLGAALITHHITTYMVAGFLLLWTVASYLVRFLRANQARVVKHLPERVASAWTDHRLEAEALPPVSTGILILVAGLSWIISAATLTVRYLAQPTYNGLREFIQMVLGTGQQRQLFQDFSGLTAPVWQRIAGIGALGLVLVAIPIGLWAIWKERRLNALMITCIVIAVLYPVTQALRLSASAWEIASRMSEFMFIVVAMVIAIGLLNRLAPGTVRGARQSTQIVTWPRVAVFIAFSTILLIGGLTAGLPLFAPMLGPLLVFSVYTSVESARNF